MSLRLMSALCILLMAGCTSSEPQNASYAPRADRATIISDTPPASAPVASTPTTDTPPAPASYDQVEYAAASGTPAPAALQPGCHTVDNVTLCDVPADPSAEDILYTK